MNTTPWIVAIVLAVLVIIAVVYLVIRDMRSGRYHSSVSPTLPLIYSLVASTIIAVFFIIANELSPIFGQ